MRTTYSVTGELEGTCGHHHYEVKTAANCRNVRKKYNGTTDRNKLVTHEIERSNRFKIETIIPNSQADLDEFQSLLDL